MIIHASAVDGLRRVTAAKEANETEVLDGLATRHPISPETRSRTSRSAAQLVREIRDSTRANLLEALLAEYGLAGDGGGVALLRLTEALMRVPDAATVDALIADKLVPVDWRRHRGKSGSRAVNAITLSLELAAACLRGRSAGNAPSLARRALKALSAPAVRFGVRQATQMLAGRFVQGRTIQQAIRLSAAEMRRGLLYSYDMLGEAAFTAADARLFFDAYQGAIAALRPHCRAADFRDNPGVSIKLSALHPRYEQPQRRRVLTELGQRTLDLALLARAANMGLNIDAEEADRLELSLEVIEAVLKDSRLAGWDGFGVVVQAYGKAAPEVIDWLHALAGRLDRRIMIRLVKGAYWDAEIKRGQVEGLPNFPVYTHKAATDIAYLSCVRKLLGMADRIYPQFAGHNAHTVSAVLELAEDGQAFEFQRIHGMGESLHRKIHARAGARCRIYAPVGEHRELLPYLARRMLENGAGSSFVSQIASDNWTAEDIAADPFETMAAARVANVQDIVPPADLFGSERRNSKGWDIHNPVVLASLDEGRSPFRSAHWECAPTRGGGTSPGTGGSRPVRNPAAPGEVVGHVAFASEDALEAALDIAKPWTASPAERGRVLAEASNLYEARANEIFALLCREAGKTLRDAAAELREAVDFLRYYGAEAGRLRDLPPLGRVACISPWNFPLAIFTGPAAGALAAGNAVLAKPAPQTPLIARLAVDLLRAAGVPKSALQLLPGDGGVGEALVSDPRIDGVAFTGSTATARRIDRRMAERLAPGARLIAETGGLNAMIVDSTALPEQAVRDILASAFQSAGQRCSALRILYVQRDVEEPLTRMLFGAMDELTVGDPWEASTDVGPLIDEDARSRVLAHVEHARSEGRLVKQCAAPTEGCFVGPAVIRVRGIEDLDQEVFGPVLHLATFEAKALDRVVDAVNRKGFGLTFGLHTRIDSRARRIAGRMKIGNVYVNRNQVGATVGSQPFGGEGLSGTGPKAGGPAYLAAFTRGEFPLHPVSKGCRPAAPEAVQALLDKNPGAKRRAPLDVDDLPGPTGESNRLSLLPRGTVLCLGPTAADAAAQARAAASAGCAAVRVAEGATGENALSGFLDRAALATLRNFAVVALWSDKADLRAARLALARREGPRIPLAASTDLADRCRLERHVCVDTAAAGGNAALFDAVADSARRRVRHS